ncbi:MAG: LysM peptidoglycan-binding domain-containing protein [Candidatus Marinimicrobia bacterium]|nr:LysM peptidoglycan-binding domain-containing protein [Candidatus Neomarinimicrobiota bacterium]
MDFRKFIIGISFLLLACFLTNCSKLPEEKLTTADLLIRKLDEQQAAVYAPDKYEMAMNFYKQAKEHLDKKDFKKANSKLDLFINTANSALVKAQNEKEFQKLAEKDTLFPEPSHQDSAFKNSIETQNINTNITSTQYVQETTHIVEVGDCLTEISMMYYGTSKLWRAIFDANSDLISNPEIIKTGMALKIPEQEIKLVEKSMLSGQLKKGEYLIEIGESLWSIANKVYPDETTNHWQFIYIENLDLIANPNLIQAGMIINIPDLQHSFYQNGDSTYFVRDGDNLWKIAEILNEKDVANNYSWQYLFQLNENTIQDPNVIYPDQLIRLK